MFDCYKCRSLSHVLFCFLSQKSGSNNSQRCKISAQLWQPTDHHILELGNECKWQVFLDKFKRFGAGLATFARGNMFGNMDVAMPAVPLGLDFFAKVLAGKFFPSLTPVVFAFFWHWV